MLLLFLMVNNNFALFMNRFLQLLILQLLPKHWENYYYCLLLFLLTMQPSCCERGEDDVPVVV